MERVLIIGSNGAGKSTFSQSLSAKAGLPLTHLDQLYWTGNWNVAPRDIFLSAVQQIVTGDKWIIEGNNLSSINTRLPYADTVFWFVFPPIQCVWNVIKREHQYRGKSRPDMPKECISKIDLQFLITVWRFNRNNLQRIANTLAAYPHLNIIRFTNYKQVHKFLEELK